MGALPSRETHKRGLYTHRHGRNRRTEIVLIPLTSDFFPDPECDLFQHLFRARQRRTAKYYFRAVRDVHASPESDYFCTTSAINDTAAFEGFVAARQETQRVSHTPSLFTHLGPFQLPSADTTTTSKTPHTPCTLSDERETDYRYTSFTDTAAGLYRVLIADNDLCLHDTDAELRRAYEAQVRQQAEHGPSMDDAAFCATDGAGLACESVDMDDFLRGYIAAKRYAVGKAHHTHVHDPSPDTITGHAKVTSVRDERATHTHTTSPAAYYVRPVPCAIVSRYDAAKPAPVDDPLYTCFDGYYVKVMGMFGLFPATLPMRVTTTPVDAMPRKEGSGNADAGCDGVTRVEQHLLKGTMFVDKDVGDQILGNMVMLATHMYVRQCMEARIRPEHLPALPFCMRTPLSNVPMLQFIREFRVRLRSLLEAGTAASGQKPLHTGMSGFNALDVHAPHHPTLARWQEEGYLFEHDVPFVTNNTTELFYPEPSSPTPSSASPQSVGGDGVRHASGPRPRSVPHENYSAVLPTSPDTLRALQLDHDTARRTTESPWPRITSNTNPTGRWPLRMVSGFNVQSSPLRHAALNYTGYCTAHPRWASGTLFRPECGCVGGHAATLESAVPATLHATRTRDGTAVVDRTASPRGTVYGAAAESSSTAYAFASPPHAPPAYPVTSSAPQSPVRAVASSTPPQRESGARASRTLALLRRRKRRFRLWIEHGHLYVWASAAYVRRACLLLAQQLNTNVESDAVPEMRCWNYRGLLHPGDVVPVPRQRNDVVVVAEDIPALELWQGDVLRCCTDAELQARLRHQPLPLPDTVAAPRVESVRAGPSHRHSIGVESGAETVWCGAGAAAPAESFWVRGSGGLDDSVVNFSYSNLPHSAKAEKQQQQLAAQQSRRLHGHHGGGGSCCGGTLPGCCDATSSHSAGAESATVGGNECGGETSCAIDRRRGTLHLENVALSWIKMMMAVTSDASEDDAAWVRDPHGVPFRMDRYIIRRVEHDGVRYFVGVMPRFIGQQRRIERVLGEVYALEGGQNGCAVHATGMDGGAQNEQHAGGESRLRDAGRVPHTRSPHHSPTCGAGHEDDLVNLAFGVSVGAAEEVPSATHGGEKDGSARVAHNGEVPPVRSTATHTSAAASDAQAARLCHDAARASEDAAHDLTDELLLHYGEVQFDFMDDA